MTPSGERSDVPVRWLQPETPRSPSGPRSWCSGAGPLVIQSLPTGENAPGDREVDSLAVVQWNIHIGKGDVGRLVDDLRGGRLTGGHPVRDFVLLLQEATRGREADVVRVASSRGLSLYYAGAVGLGRSTGRDKGNAILSSLPLARPLVVELPVLRQRRLALGAAVSGRSSRGDRWSVRFFSVHLENHAPLPWFWAGTTGARLRQGQALVAVLDSGAVVLGGDLNTWQGREPVVKYLRREFPGTPPQEQEPTFVRFGLTLDHLLFRVRPGLAGGIRRVDDTYGSDHYPLLAWLRLAPKPARDPLRRPISQSRRTGTSTLR